MIKKLAAWSPQARATKRTYLEQRSRILAALRGFFASEGFVEVETPALQISPGLEPHLMAFATDWQGPGGERQKYFLHTSPEFAMKKLLVSGWEKIFQVSHCFRNRENSKTHSPEFAMLEWYRTGTDYFKIMDDCEVLLRACAAAIATTPSALLCSWQKVEADLAIPFTRLSVAEAFFKFANVDIFATIDNPHSPLPDKLILEAQRIGIKTVSSDRWDDIFFRIFLERIEPNLGVGAATILFDYPISMAALARPKINAPDIAERFEIYICGMELANAFSELTDAQAQAQRFESDMQLKQKLYGYRYPIDKDFLDALAHGLPECAGIALGVDRMVMLMTGAPDIESVLWIPVELPESLS
jgi:elongation factor P--(R)-beta-lysine ligase